MHYLTKQFAKDHRRAADPNWVRDRCMDHCDAFVAYLRAWMADVDVEIISGVKVERVDGMTLIQQGHFAVLHDGLVYDWTARQFDPDAPFPMVAPLAEWRQKWPTLEGATRE